MTPEELVDRNLAAYAASDLEAMSGTLSEDVRMGALFGGSAALGREAVLRAYSKAMAVFPFALTRSLNRIVHPPYVVDHEASLSVTGERVFVATFYTCGADSICSVQTVISREPPQGLNAVQGQLDAYNSGDAAAMSAFFAEDAVLSRIDEGVIGKGREEVRAHYARLFGAYAHNHARLLNRVAVGPVVFDLELVRRQADAVPFMALAVYRTQAGKITQALLAA